jgi:hypothetical protein
VNGSGNIGSGNKVGSGNIVHNGDNLGVVNRPNYGGNNFGGNTTINNTNINGGGRWGSGWGGGAGGWGGRTTNINNTNVINNNVTNISHGGWGGGGYAGWGGGYGGGYRGGYYGGGGGWARPYYGNWYRGGWSNSASFWTGFGVGALTTFGVSAMYGLGGYGAYGFPAMGMYSYFPTWGMNTYSGWGLGSVANTWVYSGYTNPYYATVVAAQPVQTAAVYDYSQPINVTSAPPDPTVATSTEQVFSAARDSFKAGDYQRALDLADQVLKQTPNVAVVHEFRALCLFALKRYDDAAAVNYSVLTAGPGWNWSTLVGLYPDVDTYTNQLRALEAYAKSIPNSASAQFLLAYFYMVQGNNDAAGAQFERVVQLQPQDKLSSSFAKLYKKAVEQPAPNTAIQPTESVAQNAAAPAGPPAAAGPGQAGPAAGQESEASPPPPAELVGNWKAQPAPDVAIALAIQADGKFSWEVDTKGQKQIISGNAGFKDNTLALLQPEGPPLVGKVTQQGASKFLFAPSGAGDKGAGLTFTK